VGELDAILPEFVSESCENLDQLERDLIELEANPSSRATLDSIFRTIHTIKGGSGFMQLPKLEALAHDGETVLSRLRDGALVINPAVASALLALADCMRQMLSHLEQTGSEGDTDCAAVANQLARIRDGETERVDVAPADQRPEQRPETAEAGRAVHSGNNIRVNVEQLDKLMNLVGELVLARNQIIQFSSIQKHTALLGTAQRLNAITTQLQEGIMKTRMQPIDTVWSKLPRVVRDSAQYCGKLVRLEMEGKDTELDRTLIEAIQDPLTHVVRNCIDHGLEAPEKRVAAGKPAEGRLLLRAFHEGGQVTIEICDDGAGIDVTAIARKAIERGLITPEQTRVMSEQDLVNLIFLPGLSTAAKITSMSGRGVGMDVVKTNIEQIGGRVHVQSQTGVGTTLRMRIPLTLAIMTALVVTNGDDCYAIPQVNVLELVRLAGEDSDTGIEMIRDAAVYRLRGELLPLVSLATELSREGTAPHGPLAARDVNIVVLQAENVKFGLVVDDVQDMQEIVVKPLGRHVRGIPVFAGATILGNGRVVLILDVPGLAVRTNLLSDVRDRSTVQPDASIDGERDGGEPLLLFAGPDDARMAIRLSQLTRLEEFASSSIERVGGHEVVQYFGDVLPLVSVASLLGSRHAARSVAAGTASVQTLVYAKGDRRVGVVVDRILDTIEQQLTDLRPAGRKGVAGSLVIEGRVTEILDLDAMCAGFTAPVAVEAFAGAGA
jgi:two-component system, chemotaxis family, sensor kinase CheA